MIYKIKAKRSEFFKSYIISVKNLEIAKIILNECDKWLYMQPLNFTP